MKGCFLGVNTAMVTPFRGNKVNFGVFEQLIERQISAGVDGLIILGTTGESPTVTDRERREIFQFCTRLAKGKCNLIFGCGSNDTRRAVALAKDAQDLGADGVLAVTPYYNKCTQNGLVKYYKSICGAISIPVVAYCVPSRTGVEILPKTMQKLAQISNLAGLKDATGSVKNFLSLRALVNEKCELYSGDDLINFPLLCLGAGGVMSVLSNLYPKCVKRLYDLTKSGNMQAAQTLALRLNDVVQALGLEVNPIPVKYALSVLGYRVGTPRAPLTPFKRSYRPALQRVLKEFGDD